MLGVISFTQCCALKAFNYIHLKMTNAFFNREEIYEYYGLIYGLDLVFNSYDEILKILLFS